MACPLHNHTEYSSLDGFSKPEAIVKRAQECNFESVACTDHGVVAGHIDFYKTISKAGLKPILGMEAYQAVSNRREKTQDAMHLVLLAMNEQGLKNLWTISSEAHRSGFYYYPRTDWDLLRERNEGIICTSACRGGILQQAINPSEKVLKRDIHMPTPEEALEQYLSIYGDRFYIEIHTYDSDDQKEMNHELVYLARRRGIPIVYANDAHYAAPEEYILHEALVSIGFGQKMKDTLFATPPAPHHPPCLYIMSEYDVRDRLSYLNSSAVDEAIKNSDVIAEQCNVTLPESKNRVPVFIPDRGYKTSREMINELAFEGYSRLIVERGYHSEEYWKRFEYELEVIHEANLVDYFLIVRDYIQWARDQKIPVGPGRGSVGGSLISFLLGITEVDPLRYGLIFERFYNPGRKGSLPDIDTDFSPEGRDRVKKYVAEKYGKDRVADLTNITRMGPKMAIRDVGRTLQIPLNDISKINAILDKTTDAGISADWDEIEEEVGKELAPWVESYPKLFEWAKALHGQVRGYGIHASAVIIGDDNLDRNFPVRWAASQERIVSQWDMKIAEDMGYLKSDFLGLRNLATLDKVDELLQADGRKTLPTYVELQDMEFPDEMWHILDNGLGVGIFQVEDGGMARQICRDMKIRSIEDLAIMVAMNRPGPLRAEDVRTGEKTYQRFLRGRNGEPVDYINDIVREATSETFGMFLYQEQVLRLMLLIGYTSAEADEVRKIMGKKQVELVQAEKKRFTERASKHMPEAHVKYIWPEVENFAKYGFNKSHAIEYALICLKCLYAKFFEDKRFTLSGVLTTDKDDVYRWSEEAMRMSIPVLPPDINESGIYAQLVGDTIRLGLMDIKGIGQSHARWVTENRPYESFDQFIEMAKRDDLKGTLPNGRRRIVVDSGRCNKLYDAGAFDSIEDRKISKTEKILLEIELLGIALSDDSAKVLDNYRELINQMCVPYAAVQESGNYNVAGVIKSYRESKTKKNQPMAWVKLGFDSDVIEFTVWAQQMIAYSFLLRERVPIIAEIRKTEKGINLVDARYLK